MFAIKENLWSVSHYTLVFNHCTIAQVCEEVVHARSPYLVVKNQLGDYIAAIEAEDLLRFFNQIKASRFPGDARPENLTIQQILSANLAFEFYQVDLDNLHLRPDFWLQGRLARTVLILEQGQVTSIVPREHFRSWLESLKRDVSPFPSRKTSPIGLSKTPELLRRDPAL